MTGTCEKRPRLPSGKHMPSRTPPEKIRRNIPYAEGLSSDIFPLLRKNAEAA